MGNRMGTSIPKCLLKINEETILERLINQLIQININEITVVVGYKKDLIMNILEKANCKINFIINEDYKNDTNILSLTLALKEELSPYYLFEADCIFDNKCIDKIFDPISKNKSLWFTKGLLNEKQYGGIIKSDASGKVIDLKIINSYDQKFNGYNKLIGVMKVGKDQINKYAKYLFNACNNNTKQYYHIPWIDNIDKLESYMIDFEDALVYSINHPSDYSEAIELFNK